MRVFDQLEEIAEYISNAHRFVSSHTTGIEAYKFLRKPDGTRIPFEYMRGFRIFGFKTFDNNTLVIDQVSTGFTFKGHKKCTVSSKLFLTNLAIINVYDVRAEFFSWDSIDFAYLDNTLMSGIHMLQEWIRKDTGILRAQWTAKSSSIDKLLERLSLVDHSAEMSYDVRHRKIDMET